MLVNGELEANKDNTWILCYPNDLMDGVIMDFDDNYAFISAHTPGYAELLDELDSEGVETVCVHPDTNLSEAPHSWVINSIAKLVVHTAEEL